ncbi:MAG: DNA polymerase III subunit delta [Flavobacteriales bacterium]|nr:DNA polymerase III subunit delta [Flavobacteriales bacterium]
MTGLKNKAYQPIYFLTGDEPYYIDIISNHIENNVLEESEKSFNQTIAYGVDVKVEQILENAKRYPMMAERQVVIIKEAQNIKDVKNLNLLESYFKNPLESTILVLCYKYKKIDLRTAFGKLVNSSGFLFKSEKIRDYKLGEWISQLIHVKGYRINPKNSALLADHIGNDLSRVVNEISKTFIHLKKGDELTEDLIERNIGISKDFNNFELTDAISTKNHLKYNQIIDYFSKNERDHPMLLSVGILYSFFAKVLIFHYTKDKSQGNLASVLRVNPYFVKDYQAAARNYSARKVLDVISLLREYDAKSKGFNNPSTPNGELLKELAFKITH